MKKLILTTVCAAATLSGFAQGTIQFGNTIQSPIYVGTSIATAYAASQKATSGALSSGGTIDVALIWGTSAGSVNSLAGIEKIGTTAGQVAGNPNFAVTGTAPGDIDWFEFVAWDNSYGDTLAGEAACAAAGGLWGSAGQTSYGVIGPALQFTLGPNPAPGTVIFGSTATSGVFHLFALTTSATPEPTTLALGGLGAAALLLFRRRK
jgi:hypothetical protein